MSRKYYNHKTFTINDRISIDCSTQNTSYGFRHVADMRIDNGATGEDWGAKHYDAKRTYYNRTWEAYEYQSLLEECARKVDDPADREAIAKFAKEGKADTSDLKKISGIMALGSIFTEDQAGANDWKTRMLRAGLEGRGLMMPDDWDQLPEDEKTSRLDKIIKVLGE